MGASKAVRKGGKTALSQSIRRLEEYEHWKRSVFLRDRFTCQHCGARNGRKRVIEADHIKSFSSLLAEHGIDSIGKAKECLELWEVSNGRTLCHTCHQKTDSYPRNFVDKPKKKKRNARKKEGI
ncbi:HNH endonuclease [Spirosoma oryzicola]|uniref:HNH endonuclease n=1 Tax=Spirosoma oryzicola TaxID=2898794 RepID=UPI003CC5B342